MKNPTVILFISAFLIIILHQKVPEELRYPVTQRGTVSDTYFDTTIYDPYRWLEDDYSNSTKAWVTKQNAFTNAYMRRIPYRRKIEKRLTEIWDYPSQGMPFKKGNKYYYYKNDGLQNESVLFVQDTPNSAGNVQLAVHFLLDHQPRESEDMFNWDLILFMKTVKALSLGLGF